MTAPRLDDRLAQERRARLQAERLLAVRSEELYDANRKLSDHAHQLSHQVIEQREENKVLKGQTTQTKAQLEVATETAVTAQRRLWDALTATEDGFAIFDRDWRLVAANPAFFGIFDGIADVAEGASYETILRVAVEEGIVDLQDADATEWIDRMIARWEMVPIPRIDVKLWNGAYIRLNDKQTPQGDFVSLAVDITANIRRERQLRAARDAALAASRTKSKFLANMSHEIRTPMNGVVSMAELLRETDLSEDQQLYAETIKNSGEALLVIINDVLDFSKIEAGKLELKQDKFDLNAMVREIFRLMKPGLEGKSLELQLDYDIFLPELVIADRGRIRQVLTNLIGNAVKFTQEGHVTVHIMAAPSLDEELTLRIVVEDTGAGISPEMQEHVFGEFNQVEDEASRSHDGTGLGLAISYKLVSLMGGEMWLESEAGRGSAFGFSLPVKMDPKEHNTPVAGLPAERSRVLIIGGDSEREDVLLDMLGRLHAEPSLVRRLPSARDLEDAQAVLLSGRAVSPAAVGQVLDAVGFGGARLCCDTPGDPPDGFTSCDPGDGLAALRAMVMMESERISEICSEPVAAGPPSQLDAPPVQTPEAQPASTVSVKGTESAEVEPTEDIVAKLAGEVAPAPDIAPHAPQADPETDAIAPDRPAHEVAPEPFAPAPPEHPPLASELAAEPQSQAQPEPGPSAALDPPAPPDDPPPVTMPTARAQTSPPAKPRASAPAVDPGGLAIPGARLLAAEDNKTNQLVFRTMLKTLDLKLEIANNGLELVQAYKTCLPDLVMTDISMPEMDGLEAARQIRAYEAKAGLPRCTIIAMTAHALEGDRERILEAGLDDYITKPLKKAIIHDKIATALEHRARQMK